MHLEVTQTKVVAIRSHAVECLLHAEEAAQDQEVDLEAQLTLT
jgi:uncharacterized protein YpbB